MNKKNIKRNVEKIIAQWDERTRKNKENFVFLLYYFVSTFMNTTILSYNLMFFLILFLFIKKEQIKFVLYNKI